MRILVTGAAGFIGYHVSEALIARGDEVLGVDSLTSYYIRSLKDARIERLRRHNGFSFQALDITEHAELKKLAQTFRPQRILHLAAQAGVRYSLEAPFAYSHANLTGHLSVLEVARSLEGLDHLVYASSSSVYGANTKVPFSEADRVDKPVSLYAATKRGGELMSETYAHLYKLPQTGLRFFNVYGPLGRPDTAHWLFTDAILRAAPIRLFSAGTQRRDFTYIDDIVKGVIAAIDRPATEHRLYNLGNHQPVQTRQLLSTIEKIIGKAAIIREEPARPEDVEVTYADITAAGRDLGFAPTTGLEDGTRRFVDWFRAYHEL